MPTIAGTGVLHYLRLCYINSCLSVLESAIRGLLCGMGRGRLEAVWQLLKISRQERTFRFKTCPTPMRPRSHRRRVLIALINLPKHAMHAS